MFLNKATLVGNLTRDPELKSMPNGNPVTQFSLATNRVWKDQNGQKQEDVEFHNIVVFGRVAETCAQYLKKGQQALVEGRITTRSWNDKVTGEKKYRTEIVAETVQFGSRATGVPAPTTDAGQRPAVQPQGYQGELSKPELDTVDYGDETISADDSGAPSLDDIPF